MSTDRGWKNFHHLVTASKRYAHLRALHFVDDQFGRAIGENGLLGTEDGGETWHWVSRRTPGGSNLSGRTIYFVDRDLGHLAGRHGKLLRSFDGGETWETPLSVPLKEDRPHLFGLHFAGADHGWAVGEAGTVWHTGDGGDHWKAQRSGVRDFLMDVHFIDTRRGWAAGHDRERRRGVILGTEDGGKTWVVEIAVPDEEFNSLYALPGGEVWAVGAHTGEGRQKLLRRVPPAVAP